MNRFIKYGAILTVVTLMVAAVSGCSPHSATADPVSSDGSSSSAVVSSDVPASSAEDSSQPSSASDVSSSVLSNAAPLTELDKSTMASINDAAKQGKVLNCSFAAKANCIEDVQKVWGKGENSSYIAAAKGTYVSFPKERMAFGFNKGSQITEVRTFDSNLQKSLTLSKIEGYFGKPAYEVNSSTEKIIGYVFENPKSGSEPSLDHYSVLFPAGTVNSMADDPGREW